MGTSLVWHACRCRNKESKVKCVQRLHLQVGVVCLQGCVALLQGNSLPLQSEHLRLLTLRVTLQLLQLSPHSLALCLQSCVLQERRSRKDSDDFLCKGKKERVDSAIIVNHCICLEPDKERPLTFLSTSMR